MGLHVIFLLAFINLTHCKLINLSCSDIREFVDGHNSRRLQLAQGEISGQPAASEMKYMIWDDELAAKAAKWAIKNKHKHNPDNTVDSNRFQTGENIYWYSTTDDKYRLNPDKALESWFNEYKDFNYRPLKSSDFNDGGVQIGHYTQMAWSDSTYIGCAISQSLDEGWNSFFVVCNYGPGGNYLGKTPYQADDEGSGSLVCGTNDCTQLYGDQC